MCYKIILDIITSVGTIGAVTVGMFAIYYSNKNNKHQIKSHKLEEIFEIVQSLSKHYFKFRQLSLSIDDYLNEDKRNINTRSEYLKVRDRTFTDDQREKIYSDLSRLVVLANCYTKSNLLDKLLKFEDLMFCFSEYVFDGGSVQKEIKWNKGFPTLKEYEKLVNDLHNNIKIK